MELIRRLARIARRWRASSFERRYVYPRWWA